jgi:hypothetical protein
MPLVTVPMVVLVPLTVRSVRTPTVVAEVVTTPEARVDPVRLPAAAAAGAAHFTPVVSPESAVRTWLLVPTPSI